MKTKNTALLVNISFLAATLVLIGAFAIKKEYTYSFESLVIFSITLYLIFLEQKFKVYIENFIRILIAFIILSHLFIGEFLNLYDIPVIFDKPQHLIGTFAFSLFIYSIFIKVLKFISNSRIITFLIVFSFGIAISTCFEVSEFLCDYYLGTHCQRGLLDTNLDLAMNVVGAIAAGLTYVAIEKYKKPSV